MDEDAGDAGEAEYVARQLSEALPLGFIVRWKTQCLTVWPSSLTSIVMTAWTGSPEAVPRGS